MSKFCGTCKHFHRNADDLKRGQCREGPPHATTIPLDQAAKTQLVLSSYPNLPEDFPACDRHRPKLSIATDLPSRMQDL
jgi:hypothetical protein